MKYATLADVFKDYKWTQGVNFRDANGNCCNMDQGKECCLYGAVCLMSVENASDEHKQGDIFPRLIDILIDNMPKGVAVAMYNDSNGRKFSEILEVARQVTWEKYLQLVNSL